MAACLRPQLAPDGVDADKAVYRYLDTNGDGTGTTDSAVDHSAVAGYYYIEPPAGETWQMERLIVYIEASSSPRATYYGDITGGLTNGLEFFVEDGSAAVGAGTLIKSLTPTPIKTNGRWKRQCYDFDEFVFSGGGNKVLGGRWTLRKDLGFALKLIGSSTGTEVRRLVCKVSDDLSGLVAQELFIRGLDVT